MKTIKTIIEEYNKIVDKMPDFNDKNHSKYVVNLKGTIKHTLGNIKENKAFNPEYRKDILNKFEDKLKYKIQGKYDVASEKHKEYIKKELKKILPKSNNEQNKHRKKDKENKNLNMYKINKNKSEKNINISNDNYDFFANCCSYPLLAVEVQKMFKIHDNDISNIPKYINSYIQEKNINNNSIDFDSLVKYLKDQDKNLFKEEVKNKNKKFKPDF